MTRVFVYGSLLRGLHNHHFLASARYSGFAATLPHYTLLDLGAFPGMVANGHQSVHGEVYEVDSDTLAALDRLEGHPHFYRRQLVPLLGGACVETYLLPPGRAAGRPVIPDGDWRRHLACGARKEAAGNARERR